MFPFLTKNSADSTTTEPPPPYSSQPTSRHHPCPSARSCWPGLTIQSYNLFTCPTREILLRRICMCLILGLNTFVSILSILSSMFRWTNIPRIILTVLWFFGEAWLLHLIGRMNGERIVFSRVWTRWHFDIFLLGCVLWEVMLVGWYFGGLRTRTAADAWYALDLLEWLAVLGVGWVARWGPLDGMGTVGWSQV